MTRTTTSKNPAHSFSDDERISLEQLDMTESGHPSKISSSSSTMKLKKWLTGVKRKSSKVKKNQPKTPKSGHSTTHAAVPSANLRSHRSLRSFFPRASTSSAFSSPRSSTAGDKLFAPSLPIELWLLILQYASSPCHPFLSSSLLSPNAPLSFLDFPHSHVHLLDDYKESIRFKASLTHVCRLWNAIGQEVLYEFLWITRAREASLLAASLSSKAIRDVFEIGVRISGGKENHKLKEKEEYGKDSDWERKHPARLTDANNFNYNNKGAYTYPYDTRGVGRHIRRLHIETSSMERCSPTDLLTILDHAPLLQVYSDYRSIRRTSGFSVLSFPSSSSSIITSSTSSVISAGGLVSRPGSRGRSSDNSTFSDPLHSPIQHVYSADQQVLSALLSHPNRGTSLRRLSWTNYEYQPGDYEGGVRFYLRVVGPKLEMAKERLEFLELSLCARDLSGTPSNLYQGPGGGGFFESLMTTTPSTTVHANGLTSLTASLTSTTTTTVTTAIPSTLPPSPSSSPSSSSSSSSSASPPYTLVLPALRSLKVTLDNATFHVLSTWDMPLLQNLSVISADFSYAGEGFAQFFIVHGEKIVQLELGHSTGAIEEFWLTAPPHQHHQQPGNAAGQGGAPAGWTFGSTSIPLASWCPNLREFLCSADAEWNWQNPDWIAPHVLLPAHPGLEFIGVRDMEKRILEGLGRVNWRDYVYEADLDGEEEEDRETEEEADDDPFFMLLEQFGSLLRKEAFPSLRYVRDMSWSSDIMRKNGKVGAGSDGMPVDPSSASTLPNSATSTPGSLGMGMDGNGQNRQVVGGGIFTGFLATLSLGGYPLIQQHPPNQPSSLSSSTTSPTFSSRLLAQRQARMTSLRERRRGRRVLRFWQRVLDLCRDRGVWLEDCEGVNVTMGDLRRAAMV